MKKITTERELSSEERAPIIAFLRLLRQAGRMGNMYTILDHLDVRVSYDTNSYYHQGMSFGGREEVAGELRADLFGKDLKLASQRCLDASASKASSDDQVLSLNYITNYPCLVSKGAESYHSIWKVRLNRQGAVRSIFVDHDWPISLRIVMDEE